MKTIDEIIKDAKIYDSRFKETKISPGDTIKIVNLPKELNGKSLFDILISRKTK